MGHISFDVRYDAPIDRVFALGSDPRRVAEYMPWIRDLRDIDGRLDTVGRGFRFTDVELLGQHEDGRMEVIAVEPPLKRIALITYDNEITLRWEIRLTAVGSGTETANEVDYQLPEDVLETIGDRLFIEDVLEGRLVRAAAAFKTLVERDAAESATVLHGTLVQPVVL